MKKGKLLVVGLIALLLLGGLVMLGCEEKGMCSGKCHLDSDNIWHGCSVLNNSCAGDCAAWKDWTNNVPLILMSSCNCK